MSVWAVWRGVYVHVRPNSGAQQELKLNCVGLSSQHNECMAMAFANQSIVWMRQLLEEMGTYESIAASSTLLADNKPANIISREDIVSSGNRYIYLRNHFNKEVQEMGFSIVKYVKSDMNNSDLMTKAVHAQTMVHSRVHYCEEYTRYSLF